HLRPSSSSRLSFKVSLPSTTTSSHYKSLISFPLSVFRLILRSELTSSLGYIANVSHQIPYIPEAERVLFEILSENEWDLSISIEMVVSTRENQQAIVLSAAEILWKEYRKWTSDVCVVLGMLTTIFIANQLIHSPHRYHSRLMHHGTLSLDGYWLAVTMTVCRKLKYTANRQDESAEEHKRKVVTILYNSGEDTVKGL
ncbi:hypothetical protein Prudu_001467, partial [Prunus dulcis]